MPMEYNISNPRHPWAYEAAALLQETRNMMRIWMMREMAKEKLDWPPPEPCPCLVPCITDRDAMTQYWTTVQNSVVTITASVNSVKTETGNLYTQLTGYADKIATDPTYKVNEEVDCVSCEKIAALKQSLEWAVCKLNADVACIHGAVQALLAGYYLVANCPQDQGGDWTKYRDKMANRTGPAASPPISKTSEAQKK
jgi:hypothetical protein